jgi:hypothetical protein
VREASTTRWLQYARKIRFRMESRARVISGGILGVVVCMLTSCALATGTPPPPPNVTVAIQPTSATLFLGQTQQFQASVTGTTNTNVTWSVNGISGGNTGLGTVSATGLYTAPAILPASGKATVTATSAADAQASASAIVTLEDDIVVSVSPLTAAVPTLGAQVFTATVSGTGSPSTAVTWSVNGVAGGNSTLGTIAANSADTALYTGPAVPPTPATVSVTAISVADASKSGSASVTISCSGINSISPATASASLGQTQTFTASFCVASGTVIAWDVNGIAGGNTTVGTIAISGTYTALYTAPADLPATNPVTIHATANLSTGGPITASATVTITSNVSVTISPLTTTLAVNQSAAFTATVANTSDATVTWSVNSVPNGNSAVGQICLSGTNPCAPPTGPISGSVEYIAPAFVPQVDPVVLIATSHADPSKSGSAMAVITGPTGPIGVTVTPGYAFVPPSSGTLSTTQFFATVTGSSNTNVTWSVASGVTGQGCAGAACGSVDASGLYSAPAAAPSPNAVLVTATSVADATKSGSATVALTSGPAIETILPSSIMAGAVEGFPFSVQGLNFVPGSGTAASVILLNGSPQSTTCANAETCTMSLIPSQVESAGTFTIQIQNPGAPAALSNPVPFVIVPFDVSQNILSLTSAQPSATGTNIIVVEPTTAAESAPLNVNFIGYLTGGNNCGVQGSPLSVTSPASGTITVSICVQGDGLQPTFSYAFTGPSGSPGGSDIGVTVSTITGLFPNMMELDLLISSTTLPGARALIITDPNNNQAVVTGMLEVE